MPATVPDLASVACTIWQSMLNMELTPADGAASPEGHLVIGCVQLSGSWSGTIQLVCSAEMARTSVAAMMQMQASDLGDSDINDGLGELANMVGGSVKNTLPAPTVLSPPMVVNGADVTMALPRSKRIGHSTLCVGEHLLQVNLYQAE